jgi:hypothetical protein
VYVVSTGAGALKSYNRGPIFSAKCFFSLHRFDFQTCEDGGIIGMRESTLSSEIACLFLRRDPLDLLLLFALAWLKLPPGSPPLV